MLILPPLVMLILPTTCEDISGTKSPVLFECLQRENIEYLGTSTAVGKMWGALAWSLYTEPRLAIPMPFSNYVEE